MSKIQTKQGVSDEDLEAQKQLIKEQRQLGQAELLEQTELWSKEKLAKEQKREQLKRKLNTNADLTIGEVVEFITNGIQKHPPQFMLEYYAENYRILGFTDRDPKEYHKPKIMADITNETIYGRFDKDVLPTLQRLNKYKGYCIRVHRHYHFFNEKGLEQLQIYIADSIRIMKTCDTYYQFRKKLFDEFGIVYQASLFQD